MEQKPHQQTVIVGTPELEFRVQFDDKASDLGWGRADLFVAGEHVWFQQDTEEFRESVHWTWIDLLHFLGKNWPFLLYEETYPLGLSPIDPRQLRAEAEQRWELLNNSQVLEEDEAIFRFERRHDLATGLKGISLPSVTVVREGQLVWVCTSEKAHLFDFNIVLGVLEQIGTVISENVRKSSNARAIEALRYWDNRHHISQQKLIRLRTGLQDPEIQELVAGRSQSDYWEIPAANDDSELLAAARLSVGSIDLAAQSMVVEAVRAQPLLSTPELDQLTAACIEILSQTGGKPYGQGYAVAQWLRDRYPHRDRFDPEGLLGRFGVRVDSIELPDCPLEAVACWGPSHGPAVILNVTDGALASVPHGRRSTLAHELGHLLMDRNGSLPLAEVLGGLTPEWVEKRARAFAAELLLPRQVAEEQLDAVSGNSPESLNRCIATLSQVFDVSRSLVTHVLWNAEIRHKLSPSASRHLEVLHKQAAKLSPSRG